MATVTYVIASGTPPFTVVLSPSILPPEVKNSLGAFAFYDVGNGNYVISITDSAGCFTSFPVIVDCNVDVCLICSPTGIFQFAKSSVVVDNMLFIGERAFNPQIIKFFDINDLSQYDATTVSGVGSLSQGLESVCYSSIYNRIYFAARDSITGYLNIIEVNPTTLAITHHVITGISGEVYGIDTDGTRIYGGNDEIFFKIRISDWFIEQTSDFTGEGFLNTRAVKVNTGRGQFYATNQGGGNQLAVVSTVDISNFTIIDLSSSVSLPSDDIAYFDDGTNCNVYVSSQNSFVGAGGAIINITGGFTVSTVELLPSRGVFEYECSIYNASIDGKLEVFNVTNPSSKVIYDLGSGFIAGEVLFIAGRLFVINDESLSESKVCEYICINIPISSDCELDGTVDPATTTTTSSSTTVEEPCYPEYATDWKTIYYAAGCDVCDPVVDSYFFYEDPVLACETLNNFLYNGYGFRGYYNVGTDVWQIGARLWRDNCINLFDGYYIYLGEDPMLEHHVIIVSGNIIVGYYECPTTTTTTSSSSSSTTTTSSSSTTTSTTSTSTTTTTSSTSSTTTSSTTYLMCENAAPYLADIDTSNMGYISVGNLSSSTQTVGDYVIDWYLNGNLEFSSGTSTSGVHDIVYHPFNIPIAGGTYTPKIRWVDLDGLRYSSEFEEGMFYSPDLLDCLPDIIVTALDCSNGEELGPYSHSISYNWTAEPYEDATRTVSVYLDNTIRYFAWDFTAYNIPDRIKSYIVVNNTETLLHDVAVGKYLSGNDFTGLPIEYDFENVKVIEDLTGYTLGSGDYVKFVIIPSYETETLETDWLLKMECLVDLDYEYTCEPILLTGRQFDKTFEPTITYNVGACTYDFLMKTVTPSTLSSDFSNYVENDQAVTFGPTSWTTRELVKSFDLNRIIGSYDSIMNSTCESLLGTISVNKSGSTIVFTFTDSTDYNNFKAAHTSAYNTISLTYVSDDTDYRYYQGETTKVFNHCFDGNTSYQYYWHHSSVQTFDDINKTFQVVLSSITDNYTNLTCDNTDTAVNNAISNWNYTIGLSDGITGPLTAIHPTKVKANTMTQTLSNETVEYFEYERWVIPNFFAGCNLLTNNWVTYTIMGIPRQVYYRLNMRIIITDTLDPENNFRVESKILPDGSLGSYFTVYEKVDGTGTWYI